MPGWRTAASVGALAAALLAVAPPPEAAYVTGPPAVHVEGPSPSYVEGPPPAYVEGPPPAHVGGFGGDTCHACHFENDLDAPGGALTLSGVPDTFDPSATYRITVSLERPEMERAGFQLAARVAEGAGAGGPAGALQAVGGDERVQAVTAADGVTYAQHTEPGTALAVPGTASWAVEWRPPAADATAVVFHAAANAANDDASEFGDFIYTASATTRPAGP